MVWRKLPFSIPTSITWFELYINNITLHLTLVKRIWSRLVTDNRLIDVLCGSTNLSTFWQYSTSLCILFYVAIVSWFHLFFSSKCVAPGSHRYKVVDIRSRTQRRGYSFLCQAVKICHSLTKARVSFLLYIHNLILQCGWWPPALNSNHVFQTAIYIKILR